MMCVERYGLDYPIGGILTREESCMNVSSSPRVSIMNKPFRWRTSFPSSYCDFIPCSSNQEYVARERYPRAHIEAEMDTANSGNSENMLIGFGHYDDENEFSLNPPVCRPTKRPSPAVFPKYTASSCCHKGFDVCVTGHDGNWALVGVDITRLPPLWTSYGIEANLNLWTSA
ncbi:hypothetical protein FPOAC1_004453 [Fusarium poae]|uniref:hypothetical protein n=1 Tax=Fusarium poae TaxID=36050 RepID=UPI001CE9DE05|nr:hypothetical protein FPOAC1_004453 [Fusarium poae]KAG8671212.1 hypothetical protein FPOAC1_004453 [Fusarium poae]